MASPAVVWNQRIPGIVKQCCLFSRSCLSSREHKRQAFQQKTRIVEAVQWNGAKVFAGRGVQSCPLQFSLSLARQHCLDGAADVNGEPQLEALLGQAGGLGSIRQTRVALRVETQEGKFLAEEIRLLDFFLC